MKKWYKGDTHLHTTNSDGNMTPEKLISECKKIGLDYMIITDHNYNTIKKSRFDGDMLIIQGQELTDEPGHVNVWGAKVPHDPPHKLDTVEDYKKLIDASREAGATISLNHPFCSNCPFLLDKDEFKFDTVEVWNTVQHSDNLKNMEWWHEQLLKGNKIMAVGGSDHHRYYGPVSFLAVPTTYVLAEEKTADSILKAIREGRSVVTNSPKSSMIYLTVGSAQVGDTAKLSENDTTEITITKFKKGHKLVVYNNDKVIFTHTAEKNFKTWSAQFKIKEAGFIRAEIDYNLGPVSTRVVAFAERTFLGNRGVKKTNKTMPEMFWAFTNPIWIE